MRKRILYTLSLGHLVTDIYGGALPIFLAVFKEQLGLTYAAAGMVITLANLSSSVIQPLFGYLSDQHQLRWLLPGGCLLAGLAMAAIGYVPNYYLLVAVVFISGLGAAAFHPEGSKAAHYVAGPLNATSMSVFSVGGNLGYGMGPMFASLILLIGGLKATWLFLIPTLITSLLLYHALPIIADSAKTGGQAKVAASQTEKINYNPVIALAILILIVILRALLQIGLSTFIPLYYINYLNYSEAFASTMLTIFLISGAIGTMIGGRIADYWGAKKLIILSLLPLIPLIYLFPYTGGLLTALLLIFTGLSLVSSYAPAVVMAQALIPRHVGMASGLMMGFAMGVGGMGAPLLGTIADTWGFTLVFQALAVIPLLAAILALLLPDLRQSSVKLVKNTKAV
ncbi:MAG: MFS transporter [Clostridia bacterium]|nr:MFS transporter [Clostridia bacterium]